MAAHTRNLAAYLPRPYARCSHPRISSSMTDVGIELGDGAVLVSVPVSGSSPVVKVMCRVCGKTGNALPRSTRVDGEATDVTQLPDRDTIRPEPPRRIPGIPTSYRDTNFRSRLEARWAAFFDLIGWRWTYEPLDAEGYIPDFLIHGEAPFLVEVGPCVTEEDYQSKAEKPATYLELPTLVVGVSPLKENLYGHQEAGLMVNEFKNGRGGSAYWYVCQTCDLFYVYGDDVQRPCRHDFKLAGSRRADLFAHWAEAGNAVQWNPR